MSRSDTPEQVNLARRVNSQTDYYEILGISRTASQDEIRKCYRKVRHGLLGRANRGVAAHVTRWQSTRPRYRTRVVTNAGSLTYLTHRSSHPPHSPVALSARPFTNQTHPTGGPNDMMCATIHPTRATIVVVGARF